jgi:hypothetical protein
MTGDMVNPSKVDSTLVDCKYEDIPEESRKQFKATLQKEQEEAKKRLLACYGKTQQDVLEKDKFVMPTFTPPLPNSSTTATAAASSASTSSDVSFSFDSVKQFAEAFLGRFEQSQKLTQDLVIDLNLQNRGKKHVNDYSNQTPNLRFSVAPSENYQYGMSPNYFSGQTPPPGLVRPFKAEPVRSVQPTGQTNASAGGPIKPVNPTSHTGAMVLGSAS